jgi:uncharacterized membrane protein YphA (DoxX/SURF4 family)
MKAKKDLIKIHTRLNYFIASIWLVNGFVCKVMNLVPRHRQIVARVLGDEHATFLTILIGISEILIAGWILSGIKSKWSATLQILIVTSMNLLEFFLCPDLLLWGKMNAVFALAFILMIYVNEFVIRKSSLQ